MRVPFVDLAAQEALVAQEAALAVQRVASEARFILGERVKEFEGWLSQYCQAGAAVGVACGTEAIELSLRALDVGPGDAVVTPAFSFAAAAEAVATCGARPVFCDVDAATLNASSGAVEEALGRARALGLRVRAILPVHLFGRCAPLEALRTLADREGVALVEDAAQAIGARDEAGRSAGSVGDAGCFSFFPTKNLGAWGDAGAVVTSRPQVAARVRRLRVHGAVEPYVHAELGRNSRLDAIQAAVLLVKTKYLADWQAARSHLASRYASALSSLPIGLPGRPPKPAVHAWHAFVIRCDRRDELARWLGEQGVESRAYYPVPLHRQPCFAPLAEPPLPVAERACRETLALPIHPALRHDAQDYVIEQITRFFAS